MRCTDCGFDLDQDEEDYGKCTDCMAEFQNKDLEDQFEQLMEEG